MSTVSRLVICVVVNTGVFRFLPKSKFVRSLFLRVLAIFIIVSIAIVAIVFVSFTSEINRNVISDRERQLAVIEDTLSSRMKEATSVAYNIGNDETFYLEPVAGAKYSGYEMSNALAKYLIGNEFIGHLAYYRLSEPEKVYSSTGELTFDNYWDLYLDNAIPKEQYRKLITGGKNSWTIPAAVGKANSFIMHVCSFPHFSISPQAFLVMLIPVSEIMPLLETMLVDAKGEVFIFDADGGELCRTGTLSVGIPTDMKTLQNAAKDEHMTVGDTKYVVLQRVSASNGWTYISVLSLDDIISGPANRQLVFIILLLVLMFVAVFSMLICIIIQYKPISNLADEVGGDRGAVDEMDLLSDRFASLKDDSEQKQKYQTAFYEAEAASKAKSAFLSNMSHDIRTPMNAVIGMTAIALRHADDPAYMKECLEKVQTASQYLMDIINNVLDMSRIESGRVVLLEEVIDLQQLISGLMVILNQSTEAKRQKLIVETGSIRNNKVIGDSLKLRQIFMNILSNSVKFTPEGGTITVSLSEDESPDADYGNYFFKFSDTGIGMSPEFVSQVFDTFSRASEGGVAKTEGTGLGMAIAKNLVEIMGGTIKCESAPGTGTTFTVAMHMKLAGDKSSDEPSEALRVHDRNSRAKNGVVNLEGKRILIAEDNPMNMHIACAIIKETHAEIVRAANGKEAVDAFMEHPEGYFDVILMDLQMPVMDGFQATATIRSSERADARAVPIYAMTASTFDDDVRQVREAGMDGHVGKPYMPETLYRALEEAVR